MKQNKGEFDTFAAPFVFKFFIKFEGRNAVMRLTNRSPVFEMSLPGNWVPSEHVKLVKPDVQKERRELVVQGVAGLKPLQAGGYILTVDQTYYCFGVDALK